jgi:hypothetical protein
MDDATRAEVARVLESCLDGPHPLRRMGPGLAAVCGARRLLDALTDEDLREVFFPGVDRLLEHVQGCFACTAKALAVANLVCQRRRALADRYAARLLNHLNRRDPANDRRRDFRAEVEAAMARYGGR